MQQAKQFGCGNFTVFGPIKGQFGRFGYKCLFCGSYRCKNCGPGKLKRTRARIAEIAQEQKLSKMATLTLDPSRIPDGERSDRYIRNCWRKMRVILARRFGSSLRFVAVLEFQKSGIAHLHVLLGVYIPQDWLSEAWQSIGGGKIVDIRFVDVHRVAGYLAAYLSGAKVAHTLSLLPRRGRIFTTSRSIVLWGKKKATGWLLSKKRLSSLRGKASQVYRERYEAFEPLSSFDLEVLSYFEGPLIQAAIWGKDAIEVLRRFLHLWNPKAVQLDLL